MFDLLNLSVQLQHCRLTQWEQFQHFTWVISLSLGVIYFWPAEFYLSFIFQERSNLQDENILVLPLDLLERSSHEEKTKAVIEHFGCVRSLQLLFENALLLLVSMQRWYLNWKKNIPISVSFLHAFHYCTGWLKSCCFSIPWLFYISMSFQIDILINNGGRSQRSLCMETSIDVYEALMELNYIGTISMTKQVLPYMMQQGAGSIVTVSSVAGLIGTPLQTGYSASKHALQVKNIQISTKVVTELCLFVFSHLIFLFLSTEKLVDG